VLCPALFQGLDFRRSDNAKAAKREYGDSNRDARWRLLCALAANRAPHRRAVFVELEKEGFFQKLWK